VSRWRHGRPERPSIGSCRAILAYLLGGAPSALDGEPGDRILRRLSIRRASTDGSAADATHGNPLTGPFFVEGAEPATRWSADRWLGSIAQPVFGYQVGLKEAPPAKTRRGRGLQGLRFLPPGPSIKARSGRTGRLEFAAQRCWVASVWRRTGLLAAIGPAGYWGGNLDTIWYGKRHRAAAGISSGGLLFFGDGTRYRDGEAVGSGVETSLRCGGTVGLRKGRS